MPSYLEREQLVPVQPVIADANSIIGNLNAQQQYYGAGASQLKNAYSSFLSYDLTHPEHQAELNELMKGTQDSIKKSAMTNLGIGDNITSALKVFDPIIHNEGIMGDHALTTSIKSELGKAETSRLSNAGKNFNEASVRGLKNLLGLYATGDRNDWKQYYSIGDKYNPYYDKTEEMKQLQSMFKTDVIETSDTSHPGYIVDRKDSTWIKQKWQEFVEANASPKLREQLRIESVADFRENMLLNRNNPDKVYGYYNQQFEDIKNSKLNDLKQNLSQATMALKSMPTHTPGYDGRKKEYERAIDSLNQQISKLADRSDPNNFLPKEVVDVKNLPQAEAYVANLNQHRYFDQIGKVFAHQEISDKVRMDGSHWANRSLDMKMRELREDQLEHRDEMKWRYDRMDHEIRLAEINNAADYAIAGLRKDPVTGKVVPLGEFYRTNLSTGTGETDPKKLGQKIFEDYDQTISNGYATVFDIAMGKYFGNDEFVKALGDPDKGKLKLGEITVPGGTQRMVRDKMLDFLAEGLYGTSNAYENARITDKDPRVAKEKFKSFVETRLNGAQVKKMLNTVFSQPQFRDQVLNKITDKDGGFKLKTDLELADENLKSTAEAFNEKYGPVVKDVLKKYGLKSYYGVDSPEYKAGLRGYEQNMNHFQMITEDQIKTLVKLNPRPGGDFAKAALQAKANQIGWVVKEGDNNNFQHTVNEVKDELFKALGKYGEVGMNELAKSVTANEKNKPYVNSYLDSVFETMTGDNTEEAQKLVDIVRRNPDAVQGYKVFGTGVSGKGSVQVKLNPKELTEDDRDKLPKGWEKIRINSTSDLIEPQFKVNDPAYKSIMERPKSTNLDFTIPNTTEGAPVTISIGNHGSYDYPKFELEGSYYVPDIDDKGRFKYTADGKLVTKKVDNHDIQYDIAEQLGRENKTLDQALLEDPAGIYNQVVHQAVKMREYINQISLRKPVDLQDKALPAHIKEQLNKIKPD